LEDDALLVGQGAEGVARLNLTRAMVQPYLFGGIGWTRYQLARTPTNTSSILGDDDVLSVPFGVGISFRVARSLLLDLRGTGRAAFYDDLMDAPYAATGQTAKLHGWNVGALLGWEF
jgi:opacity protein-like surface antigen